MYGFREKHSTQQATLDIINTIQNNMDNKLHTCGIFIDLKKVFMKFCCRNYIIME